MESVLQTARDLARWAEVGLLTSFYLTPALGATMISQAWGQSWTRRWAQTLLRRWAIEVEVCDPAGRLAHSERAIFVHLNQSDRLDRGTS